MKVVDKIDSSAKPGSYINETKEKNYRRIKAVLNGMSNVADINYLQVKGVSQFAKEINETKKIQNKIIDLEALHRNDFTHEIEGEETLQNQLS